MHPQTCAAAAAAAAAADRGACEQRCVAGSALGGVQLAGLLGSNRQLQGHHQQRCVAMFGQHRVKQCSK
jgi:orotate phosphoribosyltransferase